MAVGSRGDVMRWVDGIGYLGEGLGGWRKGRKEGQREGFFGVDCVDFDGDFGGGGNGA